MKMSTTEQTELIPLLCRDREKSQLIYQYLTVCAAILSIAALAGIVMAGYDVVSWKMPCLWWHLTSVCLWFRGKPWTAA